MGITIRVPKDKRVERKAERDKKYKVWDKHTFTFPEPILSRNKLTGEIAYYR